MSRTYQVTVEIEAVESVSREQVEGWFLDFIRHRRERLPKVPKIVENLYVVEGSLEDTTDG